MKHPQSALRRQIVAASAASLGAPAVWSQASPRADLTPPAIERAFDGIHYLRGQVRVNGERINARASIKPGDTLSTGADGQLWFAIGTDAFFLRQRTELVVSPQASNAAVVGALRLITGAVGSVFGKRARSELRLTTPTATIGIRGTGTYVETRGEGVYCCTCHGEVELTSAKTSASQIVKATRHTPYLCPFEPKDGQWMVKAAFETHSDEEMEALEKCVGRIAPWAKA